MPGYVYLFKRRNQTIAPLTLLKIRTAQEIEVSEKVASQGLW